MNTDNYLAQILEQLNSWLSDRNLHFTTSNVLFARDADVEYKAGKCCVSQENLVTAEQFSETFRLMLDGGPSWVHANAIPLGGQWFGGRRFIVTLTAGQKIGNPKPSINASYEPEKTAEILSAKTLATAH